LRDVVDEAGLYASPNGDRGQWGILRSQRRPGQHQGTREERRR